jgi:hypothetical protein
MDNDDVNICTDCSCDNITISISENAKPKNEINIVNLIEENPITKLSYNYNGILLTKIKNAFTDFEQQLFVTSFYCYLNYNQKTDFVIDLDEVWKWLGFSQKQRSKILLEKHFTLDLDYKILLTPQNKQKYVGSGGHNKEKILMTVKTFKSLCLKADTKKANEIHEYYMKMEELIQDAINEESNELKKQLGQITTQLEQKDLQLQTQITQSQKEKDLLREKTLLEQFPINAQCVYYGRIDNKSVKGEHLIKFGISNELCRRVNEHKSNFSNFCLINAFKVTNHVQTENGIKRHPVLKKYIRSIQTEKNANNVELISVEKFSFEEIDEIIKTIIKETEYNVENYNIVLEKNVQLELTINRIEKENKDKDAKILELENKLKDFTPNTSYEEKQLKKLSLTNVTSNGYLLYAFECKDNRFKCGYCRPADLDNRTKIFKACDPDGELKFTQKFNFPFIEKIMLHLLKTRLTRITSETYDGTLSDIQIIFDICSKIDDLFIGDFSLQDILDKINKKYILLDNVNYDPEVPQVKKSTRPIDQIHKDTGKIVASYPSIEAAGKSIGLTTGTAVGIALRNNTLCQGYLWRPSGISAEDQMTDQPVIKVCCCTAEKKYFKNIADAARDCGISAPGLRNRIITKVHINDYHWIFDKNATHYNQL